MYKALFKYVHAQKKKHVHVYFEFVHITFNIAFHSDIRSE